MDQVAKSWMLFGSGRSLISTDVELKFFSSSKPSMFTKNCCGCRDLPSTSPSLSWPRDEILHISLQIPRIPGSSSCMPPDCFAACRILTVQFDGRLFLQTNTGYKAQTSLGVIDRMGVLALRMGSRTQAFACLMSPSHTLNPTR